MAAPQLRLEVSLNLGGFRNEVRKLTQIAQSEFNPLLKVDVDTRDYRAQLKALERIKPVIKIEDSQLDAARARIGTLNKSLATLRRATSTPIEIKLKYTEIGKPPSAVAGQIGRAVSGGVRGGQAVEGFNYKQLQATRQMMQAAKMPVGPLGGGRSVEAYLQSIVEGFKNASEESINGLSSGLKDGNSKIANAAKTVGEAGVRAIKNSLGIASPSRVFRQIGEFSVDGLEIGFLNGLKDFKNKSVAEIRKIVALMQFELAKVSGASMTPGISRSAGPRGSRQYMSPIGPLPEGSKEPWAFSQYRYQPFMAQPGQTRGANVPPMRQRFPFAGAPPVMPTVPPRMMGRSVPALPPTGGTAATREMMLAMRELEARVRSAARAASIFAEDAATAVNRKLLPAVAAGRDALQRASGQVPLGGLPAGIRGFLPPARGGGGGGNPPVPPPGGGGGGFPSDGMRGPSTQLGAGYYEVGKGLKGIQSAYGQAKKFLDTSRFPVAGAITELGSEFGNAIKQVLLFGTAYKALAFLTSLPGEAFNAAKGLATYRNQLQAVTEATGTFDQSLAFVDNLANRFNVPLTSAREGFVKLFASMQPAGFDQGQIENLFTGISKAAATFGLSADKVDRVNYAFAQMASKGQIMSEELKGQLGDVLPGALSLFADAAQMSVPEFSKAMEDGAFKGKAMEQVLDNVAILLNTKFGPSAQGAAKTLQGAVNQIQNNLQLMYESFGPVVDAAAAAFGPQINSLIKDVAETMKVLTGTFTQAGEGFDTLSPRAQAFYAAIQTLRPSLEQAGAALADLGGRLASLLPLFVQVISGAISLASSPLGRGAIVAATAVGILTAALRLLEVTGLKAALKAVYAFIGGLLKIPAATGAARVAVISLKLALTGLFVGAIFIGLDFLIGKLLNIGDAANDSAGDIRGMKKDLDAMAGARDTIGLAAKKQEAENEITIAQRLLQTYQKIDKINKEGGYGYGGISAQEKEFLKQYGEKTLVQGIDVQPSVGIAAAERKLAAASEQRGAIQKSLNTAGRLELEQEQKTQSQLQKIDLSAGDGTGKKKKEQSLESYYSLQDQLAKAQTQADIDRIQALFEHRKNLINSAYDLEEARANSVQKEAIAHQRAISNIFMDLQKKQIDARLSMMKAEGSVAGGAGAGAAPGSAVGAYLQGNIGPTSTGPHFDVKRVGGGYFPRNYLDQFVQVNGRPLSSGTTVPGGTFAGHQRRGSHGWDYAFGEGRHAATLTGGAKWQEGVPTQHGERRRFQLPSGEMFQFLHGGSEGIGAKTPGKVTPDQKRDVLADQAQVIAAKQATLSITHAEIEAQQQLIVETEKYLAQIFGVAEKEFETSMLQKKSAMLRAGATDQEIEDAMSLEEINLKYAAGVEAANNQIATNNKLIAEGLGDKNILNKSTEYQRWLIGELNKELPKAVVAQTNLNEAQKDAPFLQRIRDLKEEIKLLLIVNDAERRLAELRNEYGGDAAKAQQVFNLEEIKKNIEATRALVDDFVSSTTGDYKGFLKAILSGENAADALKQLQASLKDKVLTIFLDFAMAPIEKSLKEGLFSFFKPKVDPKLLEQQKSVTALVDNTAATKANTDAIKGLQGGAAGAVQSVPVIPFGESADLATQSMATIGDAFSSGLSTVNTSAQGWNQALNFGLPSVINTSAQQIGQQGGVLGNSLGSVTGVIGAAASSIMGIVAGVSQMGSGGTSGVLGGIGSIFMGLGGALGGIGGMFGGGLSSAFSGGASSAIGTGASGWSTAFATPLRFANGGMVTGPTLGLVGEGKYNEAIVPLPDGRSIPVQMKGPSGGGLREAMSGNNGKANGSPILNMSFQSTNINGVEYVSRDQLEQAMATTRKQAAKDGANRGMTMTLDKLQQSPQTRNRLGMR